MLISSQSGGCPQWPRCSNKRCQVHELTSFKLTLMLSFQIIILQLITILDRLYKYSTTTLKGYWFAFGQSFQITTVIKNWTEFPSRLQWKDNVFLFSNNLRGKVETNSPGLRKIYQLFYTWKFSLKQKGSACIETIT